MPIGDYLIDPLLTIATGDFQIRQGRQIPDVNDVTLQNGAVQLTATFLYSDLARSTVLASEYPPDVAAKVIRAFLRVATQAVRLQRGRPRSFDGDRVMGVFSGADGPAAAVRAGMTIAGLMRGLVQPIFDVQFPILRERGFDLSHGTGIAHGAVTVVRAGVPGNNDLTWIGAAPNIAAKLSSDRGGLGLTITTPGVLALLPPDLSYDCSGYPLWARGVAAGFDAFGTSQSLPNILSEQVARRLEATVRTIGGRRNRERGIGL